MNNPISFVQHTRRTYSRTQQKVIVEVLVQFKEENPAWIPYETLLAIKDR